MKFKGRKILKIFLITVLSIILLVAALIFSLRFPATQNYLKGHLVSYLENKVKTEVKIGRVYVAFPNTLEMQDLYLRGQKVDTLLFARSFKVDLAMWQLLNSKADITAINLEGVNANVIRNPDGSFNFDYILDAFAGDKKEEQKESKPFILSLDKIDLKDMKVSFIDQQSRNDIALYFRNFDTRVRKFDLEQNSYALGDILMDGLKLKLKQDFVEEVAEEVDDKVDSLRQKKPMKINLSGIKFTNFDIDYGDDNTRTFAKVIFKELNTKVNKLDVEKSDFDLRHLYLTGANINANLYLPANTASSQKTSESSSAPKQQARLALGKLILDDVKLAYNNTATGKTRSGIDFNHLNFNKLNTEVRNFKMENGTFAGTVNSAEIQESRGLNIQKFNTDFVYGEKQAYLKSLYLQTPRTILRDQVVLNYNSIEQLTANPGAVEVLADIKNSKIGFADILLFAPQLRNTVPFNKYPNAVLNLNTRLKGTLNNIDIPQLQASGIGDLKLTLSGKIKNITHPEQLFYDLKIGNFATSAKTVFNIVPKGTIPSNIALPSHFSVSGVAKGTTQVIDTNLKLVSTLGNAGIDALLDLRNKNNEKYEVTANLQNLQIGKIIQNNDLGMVTGKIYAKGQSFDIARGNTFIRGQLSAFDYNQYRYKNVNINGKLNRGAYNVHIISNDPNANLNLLASGIYREKNPTVKVDGSIIKIDLQKLGFYADPMILAGKLRGEFTNLNPDFLNGHLYLNDFAISDRKEVYPLQQVAIVAVSEQDFNSLKVNSQIADLEMTGKYRLTQIFGSLQNTLNSYYKFQTAPKAQNIAPNQHFNLVATVKDDDLIRKFVPELKSFETINLTTNYDADSKQVNLDAQIPQLTYGGNDIENATLRIFQENNALQYALNAEKVSTEKMALNKVAVVGNVAENIINYNVSTRDDKEVEQFLIAGNAQSLNGATQISLNPDGLKLNYTNWTVSPNNKLQFGSRGIWAENFVLSNGGSSIAINSETSSPNSPLNVDITNFQIETITEMVKKDTLLAKGTINGNVRLLDYKNLNFTSDLTVSDLQMYNNPVGNIAAKVNTKTSNILDVNVALTGFDNDVRITGDYNISNSGFDLEANINRLQMASLQGFTMGAIANSEGYLSGKMDVTGTTSKPNILGTLKFNDAGMEIVKTGSKFRNLNDEIQFVSDGINFDDFKVNDTSGNSIVFNGKILTQDYRDFNFDMTLKARDFKAVDSEADNDKMMYGVLAINADLVIKGDLDLPKVDGSLAVTDATDFTFVVPQTTPTLKDREGIVEFIDQDQVALNTTIEADSISAQSDIRGMDVNVNISLTREAKISLIIDKASGDFVKLQGEAELTGGIDPSGKTTLVGVYEVEQGAYEMTFSLIKRKFEIQKGSTITWTGEPTMATLDMTAVYKTNAAPIDLLQQQLSTDELNYYKQRIPFNTLLVLKGELMKPQLTFDITTDESNNAVSREVLDNTQTKLEQLRQDENEMNKQVFALLILNRFIGENPFQSESGISAGTMARQSVSQILSQQLNNIASDLIEGVDLTFDFDSYEEYSSGNKNTKTDLNVNLSKRLLNDRLKITVGSNFGIEGDARQNEQMTNIAGNISADYMLSKDGRYTLRAYRKNDYQVALQGQIIETGVGFVITLDYNEFKDIFTRARKNREARKAIKRAEKEVEFTE